MKNILVTGSNGFIGTALLSKLKSLNFNIFTFDIEHGNISHQDTLDPYLEKRIDHIFHLAAKTYVPDSWENPFSFYETNILGVVTALEFSRKANCSLTYLSSYMYGKPEYLPIDEKHPIKSYNPYSNSKVLAENICRFYSNNYNSKVSILRPFNVYGPHQGEHFLIPTIIKQVLDEKQEQIEVMDLLPSRDYIFIDDLIEAMLLTQDNPNGVYNIGSGISYSVEDVIKIILKHAGVKKKYFSKNKPRPNEINDVIAEISNAQNKLGWKPSTSFEDGIVKCLQVYK